MGITLHMKVKTKFMLLLVFIFVVFLISILWQRFQDLKQAEEMRQREKEEATENFQQIFQLKGEVLKRFTNDYTFWDEMVQFIKTRDKKWAKDNIQSVLSIYTANAVWVYNKDWQLIYSVNNLKITNLKQIPIPVKDRPRVFAQKRFVHFFLPTSRGLMEVWAATVHPTNDPRRQTTPRGYFFAGHLLSKKYINELANLTNSQVRLSSHSPSKLKVNQEKIVFVESLRDWHNQFVAALLVTKKFPLLKHFQRSAQQKFAALLFLFFSLLAALSFAINKWVNQPLGLISLSLTTERTDYLRELKNKPDEFGRLAKLTEEAFQQKAQLEKEIANRKALEKQLTREAAKIKQYAYFDPVTNLPNRRLFRDRLKTALEHAKRKDKLLAVMFLDLDNFKIINDTLGHEFGDKLLKVVGSKLVGLLRKEDTVSRLGGDEFTVLLPEIEKEADAAKVAGKIVNFFQQPLTVDKRQVRITTYWY